MAQQQELPKGTAAQEQPSPDEILQIEKKRRPSGAVSFTVSGELTYQSGTALVNAIGREIINNQTNDVSVEMSGVKYIDSFGIGCLLKIHNLMKEQRGVTGKLVFVLNDHVEKRVRSTGLHKIMTILEKQK